MDMVLVIVGFSLAAAFLLFALCITAIFLRYVYLNQKRDHDKKTFNSYNDKLGLTEKQNSFIESIDKLGNKRIEREIIKYRKAEFNQEIEKLQDELLKDIDSLYDLIKETQTSISNSTKHLNDIDGISALPPTVNELSETEQAELNELKTNQLESRKNEIKKALELLQERLHEQPKQEGFTDAMVKELQNSRIYKRIIERKIEREKQLRQYRIALEKNNTVEQPDKDGWVQITHREEIVTTKEEKLQDEQQSGNAEQNTENQNQTAAEGTEIKTIEKQKQQEDFDFAQLMNKAFAPLEAQSKALALAFARELRKKRDYLNSTESLLASFKTMADILLCVYPTEVITKIKENDKDVIKFAYYEEAKQIEKHIEKLIDDAKSHNNDTQERTNSVVPSVNLNNYCEEEKSTEEKCENEGAISLDSNLLIRKQIIEEGIATSVATETLNFLPDSEKHVNIDVLRKHHLVSGVCTRFKIYFRGLINRVFDSVECYEITMDAYEKLKDKTNSLIIINDIVDKPLLVKAKQEKNEGSTAEADASIENNALDTQSDTQNVEEEDLVELSAKPKSDNQSALDTDTQNVEEEDLVELSAEPKADKQPALDADTQNVDEVELVELPPETWQEDNICLIYKPGIEITKHSKNGFYYLKETGLQEQVVTAKYLVSRGFAQHIGGNE